MGLFHRSVLPAEAIASLNIRAGGIYVDGTVGGGGHAFEMLRLSEPDGIVIGIDLDEDALREAGKVLAEFGDRVRLIGGSYSDMRQILRSLHIDNCDGILLDLGVSSHQLNEPSRGFSFLHEGPLDMRLDRKREPSAYTIVNKSSRERLESIIRTYGEEAMAGRIARAIVERREKAPLETTTELAEIVVNSMPLKRKFKGVHPATKTFQAIRICVNDELEHLSKTIETAIGLLRTGGRLSIISFHSLEDRLVKRSFTTLSSTCLCPPRTPKCICAAKPRVKLVTRKPVTPSDDELKHNPRARSARLRTVERI